MSQTVIDILHNCRLFSDVEARGFQRLVVMSRIRTFRRGELIFRVARQTRIDPHRLARMLERPGCPLRVTPDHQILSPLRKREDALAESFGLLDLLGPEQKRGQDERKAAGGAG